MTDILYYELNGIDHGQEVNDLQDQLTAALSAKSDFPLRTLIKLLPLKINNPGIILARGSIKYVSDGNVSNNYSESQMLDLGDPALGKFYVSLPANIQATYSIDANNKLSFVITANDVVIQLSKLPQAGYDRSAFQIINQLIFERSRFTSVLIDQTDANKVTYLTVILADAGRSNASLIDEHQRLFLNQGIRSADDRHSSGQAEVKAHLFHISSLDVKCCDLLGGDTYYVYVKDAGPHGSGPQPCTVQQDGGVTITIDKDKYLRLSQPFSSQDDAYAYIKTCIMCIH
jgi:hypothetical protein